MKGHIRRFVNETNDVLSAEDMKRALESHGGVKGRNFIVAEVDMPSKTTQATAAESIEGISLLNNFTYEESGIRYWKAYKTGKGKLINADPEQQRPTSLKIIEAHDPNRSTTGTMVTAKSSSNKCSSLFYCEEQGCVLAFRTYQEVQLHMVTGILQQNKRRSLPSMLFARNGQSKLGTCKQFEKHMRQLQQVRTCQQQVMTFTFVNKDGH